MNYARRHAYHGSMVQWLTEMAKSGGNWYHVSVTLAAPSDKFVFERAIYLMRAANRIVHSKRKKDADDRFLGIVMFEDDHRDQGLVHAHIIARVPTGGDHTTLLDATRDLYKVRNTDRHGNFIGWTILTPTITYEPDKGGWLAKVDRGDMLVQSLNEPDRLDSILRAVSYATKELRWKNGQEGRWEILR
jgi:hypothetical protein